jgi:hypothetical protein
MMAQWSEYAGKRRPAGAEGTVRWGASEPRTPAPGLCSQPFESLWRQASFPNVRWRMN